MKPSAEQDRVISSTYVLMFLIVIIIFDLSIYLSIFYTCTQVWAASAGLYSWGSEMCEEAPLWSSWSYQG